MPILTFKGEILGKKFITTPIYYVNDRPHIGHAYTTIIGDALAHYFRLKGEEVFFLTGTDEHGQKIEQSAKKNNKSPKEYADEVSAYFKDLWDFFGIQYNHFIRTTDESHKKGVQEAFLKMFKKGDIYKGEYKGNYCVSCETFITSFTLGDDTHCPECGRETTLIKEESYFFALSKYQKRLLEWYQTSNCILPASKKNEALRFVEAGLEDLSITRISFTWGIPLPDALHEPKHIMYVWLDALMNYLTALGYGGNHERMDFWPPTYHIVGKDILRFHTIYWPAFLMSLDLPLPQHVAIHGWWTRNGVKMSKSLGNVINPEEVSRAYGNEIFRYFVLREVPFGQDGDFSQHALIDRLNSDLANTLGNLLNRVIAMADKFFNSSFRSDKAMMQQLFSEQWKEAQNILQSLPVLFENVALHRFLEELWKIFNLANTMITQYEPWKKIKEGKQEETKALLMMINNLLIKGLIMLYPVMPKTATKALRAFQLECNSAIFQHFIIQQQWLESIELQKIDVLFPRIEEPLLEESKGAECLISPGSIEHKDHKTNQEVTQAHYVQSKEVIEIGTFFQSDLRVGSIIHAESVPKSNKLLLLQVDIGEKKPRQIVAGIATFYTPQDLIGQQVCVVANLKPAKLMGIQSEGMILAAKEGDNLCLVKPSNIIANGAKIG
ncbi:methionine--tRNA ligase [Helicobacter monodelphidis]|nr:methionine--tRNA ligase [Helicobacter sp. 15-1451]RAX57017.1 methionine--tRNA ligase [Helicobacter sp. 15-1451]